MSPPFATDEADNGTSEGGVKRGLGDDNSQPQHKAFAAGQPGARLLSSAVMQSLQPARAPAPEATRGGGSKRRKSSAGGGDGPGDGVDDGDDAAPGHTTATVHHARTNGDNSNGNGVHDDGDAADDSYRAPAEGARLRVTAPEFRPRSDGGGVRAKPAAAAEAAAGFTAPSWSNQQQYTHGGRDSALQRGDGDEEEEEEAMPTAGAPGNIWGRLGPRSGEGKGHGGDGGLRRHNSSSSGGGGGGGGSQEWSDW
ncbi:unnamed protein product, partial [Ectocarpus sp. 12 AP-2014]